MLPPSKDDPTKFRDYGFVHYTERASALKAVTQAEVDKPTVDGKEVHVSGSDITVFSAIFHVRFCHVHFAPVGLF